MQIKVTWKCNLWTQKAPGWCATVDGMFRMSKVLVPWSGQVTSQAWVSVSSPPKKREEPLRSRTTAGLGRAWHRLQSASTALLPSSPHCYLHPACRVQAALRVSLCGLQLPSHAVILRGDTQKPLWPVTDRLHAQSISFISALVNGLVSKSTSELA